MSLTGTVIPLEDKPRSKCRLWELRVNMPKKGKRYPKRTRRFHGTWTEANAALRVFIAECEGPRVDGSVTFAQYADAWHTRRVELGLLAKRTLDREVGPLAAAKMHIGHKKMVDISKSDIEDMYSALMSGETPSGKPYAPWTLDTVHSKVRAVFNQAVRDHIIDSAPTSEVKPPKVPNERENVPETDSVDAMLDAMDFSDPRNVMVMLCAECGLRRSEALGMELSDWDGSRLHVARALEDDGTPKPTKNVMTREVPAPPRTKAVLDAWPHGGRLCPMKPHSLSVWWSRASVGYGMDGVTLHALRHSYATRLAEAGVHPRVMMELGGWRTIGVCMDIYTHVHSRTLDDAVHAAFCA